MHELCHFATRGRTRRNVGRSGREPPSTTRIGTSIALRSSRSCPSRVNGRSTSAAVRAASRATTALGHAVVGVDSSPTLVRLAEEADARSKYVLADAAALPFEDASFDLVIAFNSLMDLDHMPAGVREAGRVLRAGGRFCISVTHPLNDAGAFTSEAADAPFVVTGSYFARERFQETLERDGLRMTFNSQTHPLEDYAGALEEAGFVVEAMREPVPDDALCEREPRYRRWRRVPMFLHLRACKSDRDAAATKFQSVT
jgi:SAM-dependent methyltransferase